MIAHRDVLCVVRIRLTGELFPLTDVIQTEERPALGALGLWFCLTGLDAAEGTGIALNRLSLPDEVPFQIEAFRLTDLAHADLLVVFEKDPVIGAEGESAILTGRHAFILTAAEQRTDLTFSEAWHGPLQRP
jgi:hypothetical protein